MYKKIYNKAMEPHRFPYDMRLDIRIGLYMIGEKHDTWNYLNHDISPTLRNKFVVSDSGIIVSLISNTVIALTKDSNLNINEYIDKKLIL